MMMMRERTLQIAKRSVLALSVLALLATPALARDEGREEHESHGFHGERHERFEGRFVVPVPVPVPGPYAYVPSCYVQPGYWVQQPYRDQWGNVTYVRQWVPGQEVCN
jgi:hypothetical protein